MRIDVDHYLVLGVPRTADAATIRAAYVALAKRYHPDVAAGNPELAAFNFRQITDAYQTLSDPDARARYDSRVQAALDAERTRREQAAAAAWAAKAAPKATIAEKLFGKTTSKAVTRPAAGPPARRRPFRPLLPPRPAQPTAYLPHAAAMARRRSIMVVAIVLMTFIGVGGYLATRAVKGPGLQVMAAETARPSEPKPAVETKPQATPKPKPVPPLNQPSQLAPWGLPPSAPLPGRTAGQATVMAPVPALNVDGQSVCVADDGAKFAIVNRGGEPTVIYNGAAPVRASVQLADRYLVLLNNIVPSDTIIIGIKRGLETGTYIYYADTRGAIIETVAARCVGQAY
ncbi:DnaJ domain-containing protein [Reyranella sp.]|uniref:DnaJ domain-containing protein n=1 Tax=Reyranella sp. TaxID=1929291 RepID=UPI00271AA54F|nr:DnaJ domain-containing protein [Reyranella sp.]MDO8976255.1 DnaJ domain-containing protein [Reyranella sp.]